MSATEFFNEVFEAYLNQYNDANPNHSWSQTALARELGVVKTTISNWKNNISKPDERNDVLGIANALKLNRSQANRLLRLAGYSLLSKEETNQFRDDLFTLIKERLPEFYVERKSLIENIHQLFWQVFPIRNLVVHGIGGTGKTVLVAGLLLQSETLITQVFRDRVIWLDIENHSDPLLQIGNQLDIDVVPESGLDLRQRIFQQVRSLEMLWVIDGCETIADAKPWLDLVRISQGKFILTVRETPELGWLSEFDAKPFRVSDFDEAEGLKLSENILQTFLSPHELSSWKDMASLVSYHPLSLRILTGCAYFDPTLQRWETLAHEIRQQGTLALQLGGDGQNGDKNNSVHRCLQISYERLQQRNPSAAVCLRSLGIMNNREIVPELAMQLIGPGQNIGRLLAVLAQAGLLDINWDSNSYRIHQLVHMFAQTLLLQDPIEYIEAGTRYVFVLSDHLSELPDNIWDAVRDSFLWEYLPAMEIGCYTGQPGEVLTILHRTYRMFLSIGYAKQIEKIIQAIWSIILQFDQQNDESLAWLYQIHGDTFQFQLEYEHAIDQYNQVLGRSQNQNLLFMAQLQSALCYHALGRLLEFSTALKKAEQLIEEFPAEEKENQQQNLRLVLAQVQHPKPEWLNNQSSLFVEKISDVHDLFAAKRFSDGCSVLEAMLEEPPVNSLTLFHCEVLQMLAYGYLKQEKYSQVHDILDRLESILAGSSDTPSLYLPWAQLWEHRGIYEYQLTNLGAALKNLGKSLEFWKKISNTTEKQKKLQKLIDTIASEYSTINLLQSKPTGSNVKDIS